jgi:hypothetical protein
VRANLLEVHRLGDVDLMEADFVLCLRRMRRERRGENTKRNLLKLFLGGTILRIGLELYSSLLDDVLDRHVDELIEGLELLSDKTLLGKVCVNDQPACLLPLRLIKWLIVLIRSNYEL